MGVQIDVFRQRIGLYNFRDGTSKSHAPCSSGGDSTMSLRLKLIFPVGVVALLLIIAGVEMNPGPEHTCKYCLKKFLSAAQFCEHAKLHRSRKNFTILCGFPGCNVQLASVASYKAHVSRSHGSSATLKKVPVAANLSCPVAHCTTRITSRQCYSKHMVETHLKRGDTFECIFEGCKSLFLYVSQFRTHLSRYHRSCDVNFSVVESDIACEVDETGSDDNRNNEDEDFVTGDTPYSTDFEEGIDLYPDSVIKEELARFYLKLESVFILPTSTVQAIADEIKVITELSHYRLKRALLQELKKISLDKDVVASVLQKTFKEDTVFNVHHKHEDVEQLGTHHLRLQYWQKTFPFVAPQEINLDASDTGKRRCAHYLSIRKTLNVLLKDSKVREAVLKSFDYDCSGDSQVFSDFVDGSAYKAHRKLHEGPCLQLLLFQDAFDFNPFGPSSGVYKPVGFYYTLGNIPAVYRSKVDLIQLVYMVLENDFKATLEEELTDTDKTKRVLKPLLEELEDLQKNGIELDGNKIPVCLLFLLGDSLGQNTIGGFVKNFSAEFSCRFCPMSKSEYKETPYETKPLRTAEEYDNYSTIAKKKWTQVRKEGIAARKKAKEQARQSAEKISNRSSAPSKRNLKGIVSKSVFQRMCRISYKGVKYRPSALNSAESKFHVVGAQPPCLAHDLFEGVVKSVVAEVLKYCIETKGWFDFTCLNRRIKSFKCNGADARDAPAPLKSLDKLSGNACQNWNLLRLLPFMICDLIQNQEDPMWQLFLLLKQICEFVCAPRITAKQISYLQFIIESYLSRVQELLPLCLTPKHHYLCHYPDLILKFGPLIRLFTLRFESKHSFFKTVVRACKSYTNITYTMAKKHMCRFAFDHSSDLLPLDIVYDSNFSVGVNPDSFPENLKGAFPHDFDFSDVEELRRVVLHGINYSNGYCFVLRSEGTNLIVGCIRNILLQRSLSRVQFLIEEKSAENTFNGYFIVQEKTIGFKLAVVSDLPDYYALPTYKFDGKECITLKHSVITME